MLHCKEDTDDGNPDHRYRFEVVCESNHLFFWKFCKSICSKHRRNCSTNTLNIAVKHCQHRCQAKTKGKIVKVTFHRQVVKQDRKSKTRKHTSCKSQAVCEPLIFCNKVNNRLDKSTTKGKSQEDWKGTRESPRNSTKKVVAFNSFIIKAFDRRINTVCKGSSTHTAKDICIGQESSYGNGNS